MDPRIGLATSILSAFAAIAGFVAVTIPPRLSSPPLAADRTTWIEEEASGFEVPPRLRIDGIIHRLHTKCGEPLDVEFWIENLTDRPIDLPVLSYFDRRERSWSGRHPSWIIEFSDDAGRRFDPTPPFWLEAAQDRLTPINFWRVPPRGKVPLRHPSLRWAPRRPGLYTLRMALDTRAILESLRESPSDDALALLDQVPQDFLVSPPLLFIVEYP